MTTSEPQKTTRSADHGPLKWTKGTEDRLADFVEKNAKKNDPADIVRVIDEFCWNEHWMMNLGDLKGKELDKVVKSKDPKLLLELGTYCGYSAVRFFSVMSDDAKIVSIDPFVQPAARRILEHAGVSDRITLLEGKAQDIIPKISEYIDAGSVDMVFLDHEKSVYLADLRLIEDHNLMAAGATVIADNVIFAKIDNYLEHVKTSPLYKDHQLIESPLEYDETARKDGVSICTFTPAK